ncbi:MAG TPA: hypothetical protein VJ979_08150 [Actinomycetota bacterium]|nr:hypothetical protein [Actinomycetota bacterium]
MGTVLVVTIAVGVGVLVYRLTAGGEDAAVPSDDDAAAWAGEPPERPIEVPDGYIRVAGGRPSWHARLGGAMGLVIAVAVGAIGLAVSLWAVVSFLARLFADAGGGSPNA